MIDFSQTSPVHKVMPSLSCGKKKLPLHRPVVMGILNATPDSFSDGGKYQNPEIAIERALEMEAEGAEIIDIGGESTRPGAEPVLLDEELARVLPVLEGLTKESDVAISIDTSKPEVMSAAISAGCHIINDVTALKDQVSLDLVAASQVAVVLMHMQGSPRSMQLQPHYSRVGLDVGGFLTKRVRACLDSGIERDRIVIDPGFGFGKTPEHNLELLNDLEVISGLGFPVMVGLSRKSMLGSILRKPVDQRAIGSVTLALLAACRGASILRVHDVSETVDAVQVLSSLIRNDRLDEHRL